jgi:hypothetical protein
MSTAASRRPARGRGGRGAGRGGAHAGGGGRARPLRLCASGRGGVGAAGHRTALPCGRCQGRGVGRRRRRLAYSRRCVCHLLFGVSG